jgi:hypothetical protein
MGEFTLWLYGLYFKIELHLSLQLNEILSANKDKTKRTHCEPMEKEEIDNCRHFLVRGGVG